MPGWTSNEESIASFLERSEMRRRCCASGSCRGIARLARNCISNTDLTTDAQGCPSEKARGHFIALGLCPACYHVQRCFNLTDNLTDMTDSFVSSSPETQFPCPFEDKDVWPQYWKYPGKFQMRMLNAQQSNQICAYFQEAKLLQQQGHSRSKSYRFEMQSLAQYFGKERSVFSKVVTNSIQYKELMSAHLHSK